MLVAVPIALFGWLFAKRHVHRLQKQKGGRGSVNVQVAGNLEVGKEFPGTGGRLTRKEQAVIPSDSLPNIATDTNHPQTGIISGEAKSFSEFELKQPGDIHLDEYLHQLEKLKGRFFERDQLRKNIIGKSIVCRGQVEDVRTLSSDKIQICLRSPFPIVFAEVDRTNETAVYSLLKGDLVEVRGIVKINMETSLTVEVTAFKRVGSLSNP